MPFKKGQSGNPGGRKRSEGLFREACRLAGLRQVPDCDNRIAIQAVADNLFRIGRDKSDPRAAIAAAEVIRDTLDGRPVVAVAGPTGTGPVQLEHTLSDAAVSLISSALDGLTENKTICLDTITIDHNGNEPLSISYDQNAAVMAAITDALSQDGPTEDDGRC